MPLLFKRRDDSGPGEHARLPIQLERLPFATLDATDDSRVQLSLSLTYGDQVATWEASATTSPDPATWEASTAAPDGSVAVLPGPFGNDLWVALGCVWNAMALTERDLADPEHRTITLGFGELIRLMGKSWGRPVYDALEETVDRLGRVTIVAQGTWKDGEYVRERVTFPLFDMTRTRTRRDGDVARNTATFRLSLEVAKALVRHSRLLNTRELYRLKSPTARRLYRLLEAERYNRDRLGAGALTLSLSEIRDRMPLAHTKPAQLRRTLGRAHTELQAARYLSAEPRYTRVKEPGVRAPVVSVTYAFTTPSTGAAPGMAPNADERRDLAPAVGGNALAPAPAAAPGEDRDLGPEWRAQMAALVGTPLGGGAPGSDLAWWVREIERTLGDRRSSGFYKQVVEAFANAQALDALEFVLRGVQRDGAGMPARALGAAFTARVKARAAELQIALPVPATGPKRGAGVTALGALLPNGARRPGGPLAGESTSND